MIADKKLLNLFILFIFALFISSNAQAQQQLTCTGAAYYPNIGQEQLFFQLVNVSSTGTLVIKQGPDDNLVDLKMVPVEPRSTTIHEVVKLNTEITADINAQYIPEKGSTVSCMFPVSSFTGMFPVSGFTEDTDDDGVPDIVDSDPFDGEVMTRNDAIASTDPLPVVKAADGELIHTNNIYFSRDTVVRSLLSGQGFDYVELEGGEATPKTYMAMTEHEYFGVSNTARVFESPTGSECDNLLTAMRRNNLRKVRITEEVCTEVTGEIALASQGMQRYAWVEVNSADILISRPFRHGAMVLPEVGFNSQTSYLLSMNEMVSVTIGSDASGMLEVPIKRGAMQQTTATTYELSGTAGEVVTYWISGTGVWTPTGTVEPMAGGQPSLSMNSITMNNIEYAVGANNHVRLAVGDASYLRQILLYEVANDGNISAKPWMIAGETTYYVVADIETNILTTMTSTIMQKTTNTEVITDPAVLDPVKRATAGHRVGNALAVIEVKGISATAGTLELGWETIDWDNSEVSLKNIVARYAVEENSSMIYDNYADNDGDRIPDGTPGDPIDSTSTVSTFLPVDLDGDDDLMNNDNDRLITVTNKRLFVTDIGLLIATREGRERTMESEVDYSAANIEYTDDIRELVGNPTDPSGAEIVSIATFGVRDVIRSIDDDGGPVGGTVYTIFPVDLGSTTATSYSLWKLRDNRWQRFERSNLDQSSWYMIERENVNRPCPTDVVDYRLKHPESIDGFTQTEEGEHCVMVAITDGGNYDSSELDGRIIDPLGLASGTGIVGRGGGRGGGAIGTSDILLLMSALLLLLMVSARRPKTTSQ